MNMKKEGSLLVFVLVAANAFASGFGLYEASSRTYAMGGAVVGKAVDASANFHNPATLTDLTNVTVTVGVMTEHPRARIKVDGKSSEPMNPGVFLLPSFQVAVPLWYDFSFGLGVMPEYGLGSAYDDGWSLCGSSEETTVTSFSVNPNLAWKLGDFSIGAGLRFLFFDFEQYSTPSKAYGVHHRLKGDNGMGDFGYQVGMKYDVTDDFALGLVYKSLIVVNVDGKSETDQPAALGGNRRVPSQTDLELPQSITGGFNWDITDDWHLGGMVAWTQWSSIGTLDFNLGGQHTPCVLNWNDTWRAGLAPSWDFAEDWTAIMSYVYENDCCGDQESTMLPAADRHMLSWGLCWNCWSTLEIAVTYGMILMDGKDSRSYNGKNDADLHHYRAYRGISHAAGLTLTYRF